jgi:hypothetical protein
MPDPGGEPCLDQAVRVRLVDLLDRDIAVDLLDGDIAVEQLVAASPHSCCCTAAHQLGQPVTAGQQHTGVGICPTAGRPRW